MTPSGPPDLSVSFAGIELKNPIIAASGTFGYGIEFEDIVHLDKLGGFVSQGSVQRTYDRQSPAAPVRDARRNAECHRVAEHWGASFRG